MRTLPTNMSGGRPIDKSELLKWCQDAAADRAEINNFHTSWNDGRAFCAILHGFFPTEVPLDTISEGTDRDGRQRNFELAFKVARAHGAKPLFDVEDMLDTYPKPDDKSIITWLTLLRARLPGAAPSSGQPTAVTSRAQPPAAASRAQPPAAAPASTKPMAGPAAKENVGPNAAAAAGPSKPQKLLHATSWLDVLPICGTRHKSVWAMLGPPTREAAPTAEAPASSSSDAPAAAPGSGGGVLRSLFKRSSAPTAEATKDRPPRRTRPAAAVATAAPVRQAAGVQVAKAAAEPDAAASADRASSTELEWLRAELRMAQAQIRLLEAKLAEEREARKKAEAKAAGKDGAGGGGGGGGGRRMSALIRAFGN